MVETKTETKPLLVSRSAHHLPDLEAWTVVEKKVAIIDQVNEQKRLAYKTKTEKQHADLVWLILC